MADLLNIGRSGVMAAQKQLQVTSQNIANVGSKGYSRQVAEQRSSESTYLAGSYVGTGTTISDVKRIYSSYAAREQMLATSQLAYAEQSWRKADELNEVMSVSGKAIPNSLNTVFKAINNMADIPNDISARSSVLVSLKEMTGAFDTISEGLTTQLGQTNEQINSTVERVNELTKELAKVNTQLLQTQGEDLQLLDHQGRLLTELGNYIQVNVIEQEMGVKSVMMGGTAMLVAGDHQLKLGTTSGDPVRHELRYTVETTSNTIVLDQRNVGGQLQALSDYRDNILLPAERELGKMALGVADAFNTAQKNGLDLNGQVGVDLFADINSPEMSIGRSATSVYNAGATEVKVNIDDAGLLTGGKYRLEWDGANYQLTDELGRTSTLAADPANANRFVSSEGFSIVQDTSGGNPVAGDKWDLMPTANASTGLNLIVDDPKALAAAGYTKETVTGDGEATLVSVTRTNPALPKGDINLSITPNNPTSVPPGQNTYTLTDSQGNALGNGVYTGDTITALGFSVKVEGNTTATSSFKLNLDLAVGNNANAVAMGKISTAKIQASGKSTLVDTFEGVVNKVGSHAASYKVARDSADAVFKQAESRVQSKSGVNLDEEAGNLVRFQKAYQASARVMTVAKETFDTLFSALR